MNKEQFMTNKLNKNYDSEIKIGVIIPCYRVKLFIIDLISKIGPEVDRIFIIDDCCPEGSGKWVQLNCQDPRVSVIHREINGGVGAAVMTGYQIAMHENLDILVKLDGDGQMDPSLILNFTNPITNGYSDYTKGNRFFEIQDAESMPKLRWIGNAILSFINKLTSGYWDIFDPTNGYTAIHIKVLKKLPLNKISQRYFFESDMLFRLNLLHAVVQDVPMKAVYGDEISNLKIKNIIFEFTGKHFRNGLKRIFYNYFLHNISVASIELPIGLFMISFGAIYGGLNWINSVQSGIPTLPGTVMLAAINLMIGIQLILAFLAYDIAQVPKYPLHKRI